MNHMPSHVRKHRNPNKHNPRIERVTSYSPTRKPTKHEFDTCPRIELTYLTTEWDLHSTTFQEQEEASMDDNGKLHEWSNKRKNVDRYISMFELCQVLTPRKERQK